MKTASKLLSLILFLIHCGILCLCPTEPRYNIVNRPFRYDLEFLWSRILSVNDKTLDVSLVIIPVSAVNSRKIFFRYFLITFDFKDIVFVCRFVQILD